MNDNVFVLLEDPLAPTHTDVEGEEIPTSQTSTHSDAAHYRSTFLTLRPPGALEQLLAQLRARWTSVRQSAPSSQKSQQTNGQQLLVDGNIFAIGSDWLVRVGNVFVAGGAVKGMLLEVGLNIDAFYHLNSSPKAEYLPLPALRSQAADGTSELLSNLLTSVLPNIRDAKIVAVTISDSQWKEVLWDREVEERGDKEAGIVIDQDDIYAFGEDGHCVKSEDDWTGVERDRRSAFLIMGALKSEGIL